MWKEKETIAITKKERIELEEAGTPMWVMNTRIDLGELFRLLFQGRITGQAKARKTWRAYLMFYGYETV